jgi:hypothetical protein
MWSDAPATSIETLTSNVRETLLFSADYEGFLGKSILFLCRIWHDCLSAPEPDKTKAYFVV